MALDPILWALKDAPVADLYEKAVLWVLAEKADEDGSNAFPSLSTVADLAMCDEQTVKDRIRKLIRRGLIRVAPDQSPADYLPAHRRPRVYELLIPYSWYGKGAIERVNQGRVERGRDPLTPENRPDLAPAPPRKRRADAKPTKRGSAKRGGVQDPPTSSAEGRDGGVYDIPLGGMCNTPGEGVYNTPQPSPKTLPNDPPLPGAAVEQSGAAGRGLDQAGRQEETGDQDQQAVLPDVAAAAGQDQAVQIIQAIRWPARTRADRGTQRRLTTLAGQCLAAGHPAVAVQAAVTEGLPAVWGAGLLVRRLEELAATTPDPAVAAAAEREAAAADKARMATTSHAYQQGRSVGWCVRCGQHEGNRVHREHQERVDQDQEPAVRSEAPDTGQAAPTGRCQHGRRVCVTCHGGRPDDTTSSGDRQRPAPRQRPAADPDPAPVSGPTPAGQEFHRALAAMAGRMVAA